MSNLTEPEILDYLKKRDIYGFSFSYISPLVASLIMLSGVYSLKNDDSLHFFVGIFWKSGPEGNIKYKEIINTTECPSENMQVKDFHEAGGELCFIVAGKGFYFPVSDFS